MIKRIYSVLFVAMAFVLQMGATKRVAVNTLYQIRELGPDTEFVYTGDAVVEAVHSWLFLAQDEQGIIVKIDGIQTPDYESGMVLTSFSGTTYPLGVGGDCAVAAIDPSSVTVAPDRVEVNPIIATPDDTFVDLGYRYATYADVEVSEYDGCDDALVATLANGSKAIINPYSSSLPGVGRYKTICGVCFYNSAYPYPMFAALDWSGFVAGVECIEQNDSAPIYYDLKGIRVENPRNGVFVQKQGEKIAKLRK